jgi:hypothetical protein
MNTTAAMTRAEESSGIRNAERSSGKPKQTSGIPKHAIPGALGQQPLLLRLLALGNFGLVSLAYILFGLSMYGWTYTLPLSISIVSMAKTRRRSGVRRSGV